MDLDCRKRLREFLSDYFNLEELRTLCFDLGIDYDDLGGEGKSGKARELVALMERQKRIPILVAEVTTRRPNSELINEIERRCREIATPLPDLRLKIVRAPNGEPSPEQQDNPPPHRPEPELPPPLPAPQLDNLRALLEAGHWQQADVETFQVLLTIAEREKEGSLRSNDIAQLPCRALQQIDTLWQAASDKRFGWSTQLYILYTIADRRGRRIIEIDRRSPFTSEHMRALGDRVGWRRDNQWCENYRDLQFSLDAPEGHLPSLRSPRFDQTDTWLETWKDGLKAFLWRMNDCLSTHTFM